jgi:DNA-directed RNA polymerase specialized sigma24 family protein
MVAATFLPPPLRPCAAYLVENARRKARAKHGGGYQRLDLDAVQLAVDRPPDYLLALDEALSSPAEREGQTARLVELHCFAGLSIDEAAGVIGISTRTANRDWGFARAWLYRAIRGSEPGSENEKSVARGNRRLENRTDL